MRKLMWITIGFALSCGLWAYGRRQLWILPGAIALLIFTIGGLSIRKQKQWIRPAILVLAGSLFGLIWSGIFHLIYLRPLEPLNGATVSLSVTASDNSHDTGYGIGLEGLTTLNGKTYRVRAYLRDSEALTPGDRIDGLFRLELTTAGEKHGSTYFQGQGIFLLAYQQDEVQITRAETAPLWCFPSVLRHRILTLLEELFPGDTAPFAKALLLGDRRDLDYATTTALEASGIAHIVAVSGLHVSILYATLSSLTMHRRFLTALIGMPALLVFAAVAGFTPSVLRACLMVWLMMLTKVFKRGYDSVTALAFAVLVMLAANPMAVTSVSLQLSAGCVAGILLFSAPIQQWLEKRIPGKAGAWRRGRRLFCGSVSVTFSAMTLITPLSAFYFGAVSLVSALTNLLTVWVTTAIFNGLIVTVLTALISPGFAGVLAGLLSWPIRYVLAVAKMLASWPLAAAYTNSVFIVLWMVFAYLLLVILLLRNGKRPGRMLCWGTMGLCLALLASWLWPLTADTAITMLDVGQGQSILLQSEGKTFLVDCGGEDEEETADLIAQTLLSQGIRRLDGIFLTHYDEDHGGALRHLLTRIETDYLFLPDVQTEIPVPETAGRTVYVREDLELSVGETKLLIYGPFYGEQSNENSLCVLFDTENCDILITGDRGFFGEKILLRQRNLPQVDILVAGHHGSEDSTSEELLRQVRPDAVWISVGRNNRFDHPAPGLLQRLKEFGCAVCRTDTDGTITIRR